MLFRNNFPYSVEYPTRKIPVRRGGRSQAPAFPGAATRLAHAQEQITERDGQHQNVIAQPVQDKHNTQPSAPDHNTHPSPSEPDWRANAQRLQADMDNFRKRQERRAEDAIAAERNRLLNLTLSVADNLSRALDQKADNTNGLREGVELTYRELERLLEAEGISRLETVGQPFDPNLHEALATMPSETAEANVIVEEVEAGYTLNDKLLRPAKVVVAAGTE